MGRKKKPQQKGSDNDNNNNNNNNNHHHHKNTQASSLSTRTAALTSSKSNADKKYSGNSILFCSSLRQLHQCLQSEFEARDPFGEGRGGDKAEQLIAKYKQITSSASTGASNEESENNNNNNNNNNNCHDHNSDANILSEKYMLFALGQLERMVPAIRKLQTSGSENNNTNNNNNNKNNKELQTLSEDVVLYAEYALFYCLSYFSYNTHTNIFMRLQNGSHASNNNSKNNSGQTSKTHSESNSGAQTPNRNHSTNNKHNNQNWFSNRMTPTKKTDHLSGGRRNDSFSEFDSANTSFCSPATVLANAKLLKTIEKLVMDYVAKMHLLFQYNNNSQGDNNSNDNKNNSKNDKSRALDSDVASSSYTKINENAETARCCFLWLLSILLTANNTNTRQNNNNNDDAPASASAGSHNSNLQYYLTCFFSNEELIINNNKDNSQRQRHGQQQQQQPLLSPLFFSSYEGTRTAAAYVVALLFTQFRHALQYAEEPKQQLQNQPQQPQKQNSSASDGSHREGKDSSDRKTINHYRFVSLSVQGGSLLYIVHHALQQALELLDEDRKRHRSKKKCEANNKSGVHTGGGALQWLRLAAALVSATPYHRCPQSLACLVRVLQMEGLFASFFAPQQAVTPEEGGGGLEAEPRDEMNALHLHSRSEDNRNDPTHGRTSRGDYLAAATSFYAQVLNNESVLPRLKEELLRSSPAHAGPRAANAAPATKNTIQGHERNDGQPLAPEVRSQPPQRPVQLPLAALLAEADTQVSSWKVCTLVARQFPFALKPFFPVLIEKTNLLVERLLSAAQASPAARTPASSGATQDSGKEVGDERREVAAAAETKDNNNNNNNNTSAPLLLPARSSTAATKAHPSSSSSLCYTAAATAESLRCFLHYFGFVWKAFDHNCLDRARHRQEEEEEGAGEERKGANKETKTETAEDGADVGKGAKENEKATLEEKGKVFRTVLGPLMTALGPLYALSRHEAHRPGDASIKEGVRAGEEEEEENEGVEEESRRNHNDHCNDLQRPGRNGAAAAAQLFSSVEEIHLNLLKCLAQIGDEFFVQKLKDETEFKEVVYAFVKQSSKKYYCHHRLQRAAIDRHNHHHQHHHHNNTTHNTTNHSEKDHYSGGKVTIKMTSKVRAEAFTTFGLWCWQYPLLDAKIPTLAPALARRCCRAVYRPSHVVPVTLTALPSPFSSSSSPGTAATANNNADHAIDNSSSSDGEEEAERKGGELGEAEENVQDMRGSMAELDDDHALNEHHLASEGRQRGSETEELQLLQSKAAFALSNLTSRLCDIPLQNDHIVNSNNNHECQRHEGGVARVRHSPALLRELCEAALYAMMDFPPPAPAAYPPSTTTRSRNKQSNGYGGTEKTVLSFASGSTTNSATRTNYGGTSSGSSASSPSSVQSHGVRMTSFLLRCLTFSELQTEVAIHPRLRYYFGAPSSPGDEDAVVQRTNKKDSFYDKYGLTDTETVAAAFLKCLLFWFDYNHHTHPPPPSEAAMAAAAAAAVEQCRSSPIHHCCHRPPLSLPLLLPVVRISKKVEAKVRWNIAHALAEALHNPEVYECEPFLYYEAVHACLYVIQEDAIFKVRTQAALALAGVHGDCVALPEEYIYAPPASNQQKPQARQTDEEYLEEEEGEEEEGDPILIVILKTIVRALQGCQQTSTFFQFKEQHALHATLLAALQHCWQYTRPRAPSAPYDNHVDANKNGCEGSEEGRVRTEKPQGEVEGAVSSDAWPGLAAALAELPPFAATQAPLY